MLNRKLQVQTKIKLRFKEQSFDPMQKKRNGGERKVAKFLSQVFNFVRLPVIL